MNSTVSKDSAEPDFVSRQVSEARRYYLNLDPARRKPLTVVCGGVERTNDNYLVSRDDFPYFAIELVAEGSGSVTLNGRKAALGPGAIFAYGPGVRHTIRCGTGRPMRKYYVDFCGRKARELLGTTVLRDWQVHQVTALHELVKIFEQLSRETTDDGDVTQSVCDYLLHILLLKIGKLVITGNRVVLRSHVTYARLRDHIERNYLRLESIEQAARECGMSPMHASRLFQRFGHTGAYRFLLRLKLNHAAHLMVDKGLLVKEAAEQTGFPDAFQFSRAFKRIHGIPPVQLLSSRLGKGVSTAI